MQKIAVKKSASEAMAKHTDAECLAKSAFAQIKGTEKLPNDAIDRQDDAQAMQRGCRFPQPEVSPPDLSLPGLHLQDCCPEPPHRREALLVHRRETQ